VSSLRERIAQAMFEADERSRETVAKISRMAWSEVGDQYRANWLERADAAIAAIEASGTHVVVPVEQYDRMQGALEQIVSWSKAYPLDIFPEPDLKKARELLEAGGVTLDAVSAHCMRHVVDRVADIALAARPLDATPTDRLDPDRTDGSGVSGDD